MKYKRNGRVVILEKVFLCLLLTLLFCGFCACDYDNLNLTEITYQIPQLKSDYEQYEGQVGKYDSPYTVCYKNNDGKYTMYIFSSPIQYKSTEGYQLIDNTLISSEETGFVYENRYNEIKVYLPESIKSFIRIATKTATLEIRLKETGISFENAQRVNFENMYGDEVDAVRYGSDKVDLYLYAIASGLKLEIHSVEGSYVPDLVFVVRSSDTLKQYNRGNYIEFLDSKDAKTISSLIRKPLAMFENDGVVDMSTQTQMKIEQAGDEYELRYDLHKAAAESSDVKLDASFEMYLSSMADCSVYSKYKINNYLDN